MTGKVASQLTLMRAKGAMKEIDVANLLRLRHETISRWNQGRYFPTARNESKLNELVTIIERLAEVYQPKEVRQWMFAPQTEFHGVSAATMIESGRAHEVTRLTGRLRDAVQR